MRLIATLAILVSLLSGVTVGPEPRENGGTDFWEPDLDAATVGDSVRRLARAARMRDFRWEWEPGWLGGQSQISARDQARFFFRYPRYLPKRHRRFARRLLGSIVSWQRWGIADAHPTGWRLYFKGGWGIADDGIGTVNHQLAFLERGQCRIALAILTEHNPSTLDGAETQRGIAKRLLRDIRRAPALPVCVSRK